MGIPSNNGGQTLFEDNSYLAGGRHQYIDETSTDISSGLSQDGAERGTVVHREGSKYLISTHSMIYLYSL